MKPFQLLVAKLLFDADASRTVLHSRQDSGRLEIVAEAVRHGADQVRNVAPSAGILTEPTLELLGRGEMVNEPAVAAEARPLAAAGVKARMVAPILIDGKLAAAMSVHDTQGPRSWSSEALSALERTRDQARALLDEQGAGSLRIGADDVKGAAVQAVLDMLRRELGVQRCTFRQPVLEAFAFPVAFESRADGLRSLLGDFTIVQTGQPVINKLLESRAQVVQADCRVASDDPLFHVMLDHYGNMRAQIVTPHIVGDELKGVLSIHELGGTREWTAQEQKLAADATRLIGNILGS